MQATLYTKQDGHLLSSHNYALFHHSLSLSLFVSLPLFNLSLIHTICPTSLYLSLFSSCLLFFLLTPYHPPLLVTYMLPAYCFNPLPPSSLFISFSAFLYLSLSTLFLSLSFPLYSISLYPSSSLSETKPYERTSDRYPPQCHYQ